MEELHLKPTRGDTLYETFFCGGVGGAAVVLFFLTVDLITEAPLYTPSLVGSVLYLGVDLEAVEGVSLTAVSVATVGHLATFLLVGFATAWLERVVEERSGGSFAIPVVSVLALLEVASLVVFGILRPELGAEVGHGLIFAANLLSAVAMVAFLRQAHRTSEALSIAKRAGVV